MRNPWRQMPLSASLLSGDKQTFYSVQLTSVTSKLNFELFILRQDDFSVISRLALEANSLEASILEAEAKFNVTQ